MLFPEPAISILVRTALSDRGYERTFPMYPQQRGSCPPFVEDFTLEEPVCCSLVMDITSNVVVC